MTKRRKRPKRPKRPAWKAVLEEEAKSREKAAEEKVRERQEADQARQGLLNTMGTGRRAISDRDRAQLRQISQSDRKPSAMNQGG